MHIRLDPFSFRT